MPPAPTETRAIGLKEQTLEFFQVVHRADFASSARKEFLTRISILRDGRFIHFEQAQSGRVINPHRRGISVEKFPILAFGEVRGRQRRSLGRSRFSFCPFNLGAKCRVPDVFPAMNTRDGVIFFH